MACWSRAIQALLTVLHTGAVVYVVSMYHAQKRPAWHRAPLFGVHAIDISRRSERSVQVYTTIKTGILLAATSPEMERKCLCLELPSYEMVNLIQHIFSGNIPPPTTNMNTRLTILPPLSLHLPSQRHRYSPTIPFSKRRRSCYKACASPYAVIGMCVALYGGYALCLNVVVFLQTY